MTTEFIDIKQELTVEEAFKKLKESRRCWNCWNNFVTDSKRKIQGVLSIKDLILANSDDKIENIMNSNVVYSTTHTDQEEVSKLFDKYDFYALPIIDTENRLVGIVTVDDIMDVVKEEATEDMEIMAAISPTDDPYLKTSAFTHAKKEFFGCCF